MIKQIVEEALLGNYTNFAELFKGELSTRLHEAIEAKKQTVIDSTHNMCESCDSEDDEEDEEYFDVDENQDVEDAEEEVEEGYYGNPHSKKVKKEAMDPVGKEDGDIDNDGDKDSSDKYLLKRRKAIGKAMKKEGAPLKKAKSGGGY